MTRRLPVTHPFRLIRLGDANRLTRGALLGLLPEDINLGRYDPA